MSLYHFLSRIVKWIVIIFALLNIISYIACFTYCFTASAEMEHIFWGRLKILLFRVNFCHERKSCIMMEEITVFLIQTSILRKPRSLSD